MNVSDQRVLGNQLLGLIRREQARITRRKQVRKFFGLLFKSLLTGFLIALLRGWLFMLAVGVVHEHWMPQVPTIGYWWAVLIWWLLPSSETVKSKPEGGA